MILVLSPLEPGSGDVTQDLDVTISDIVAIVAFVVGDEPPQATNPCFLALADLDGNDAIGVQVLES